MKTKNIKETEHLISYQGDGLSICVVKIGPFDLAQLQIENDVNEAFVDLTPVEIRILIDMLKKTLPKELAFDFVDLDGDLQFIDEIITDVSKYSRCAEKALLMLKDWKHEITGKTKNKSDYENN